jgi:flagellar basal body-associated protein FliL
MHVPPVNWLAILVAGIVIFILGGLWYSPILFAKKWIALQNKTEEQMRAEAAGANMPLMYASAFITGLIIAWAMALVFAHIANDMQMNAAHGALLGFILWLGFAASTSYATALFSGKPRQLWLIDTAYNLVSFVLAGIILAVWR